MMQLESQGSGLFSHNGHAETLPSSPDQADNYNKKIFFKGLQQLAADSTISFQ